MKLQKQYNSMRLLIITQKVNKQDPILGFFHRWIIEFAKHSNPLTVICLERGGYDLPSHVKVLSLGKEKGVSRIKYILNFYTYIWRERKNYDAVFVHMNQEYVILGWKFWKLWGKKIFLWRNHAQGNFLTRIAVWVSDRVFCTSKESFTAQFKKTEIMPVGVSTEIFKTLPLPRIPHSILMLGRISPVKRVELFIETLKKLKNNKTFFKATLIGEASERDKIYTDKILRMINDYGLSVDIFIRGAVDQGQVAELFNTHEVVINLTPSGSLDKTIFEAMACGALVLASNKSYARNLSEDIKNILVIEEDEKSRIAEKIEKIFKLENRQKGDIIEKLKKITEKKHSLKILIERLLHY